MRDLKLPENNLCKIADYPEIYKKYTELITTDSDGYIATKERIKADCKVTAKVISPLKAKGLNKWHEIEILISDAYNNCAFEGFLNGYLYALSEYNDNIKLPEEAGNKNNDNSDNITLAKEDLRKLKFIASELLNFFDNDDTTKEGRNSILYDFKHSALNMEILLDYISQLKFRLDLLERNF